MSNIEMPDFDKMTPEEIQLWMESLAKKQGATEGLITSADMQIADIDPNSVVIDEPGYVPSETFKSRDAKQAKATAETTAAAPKAEAPKAAAPKPEPTPEPAKPAEPVRPAASVTPPPPLAPATQPPSSTPPRGSGERVRLPTDRPESTRPAAAQPSAPAPRPSVQPPLTAQPPVAPAAQAKPAAAPPVQAPPPAPAPAAAGGDLAWLESLAAGLPDDALNLDLSGLDAAPAAPAAPVSSARAEPTNPESWLESLVSSGGELDAVDAAPREPVAPVPSPAVPREPAAKPPAAFEEPPSWLDSLSKSAELPGESRSAPQPVTSAPRSSTPDPTEWLASLSASGELGEPDTEEAETPSMLPTLASESDEDSGTISDIETAIREGRVSPEQMQVWLDRQTDILVSQPEITMEDFYDPDAPPVPADLPDWFLESVGPPQQDMPDHPSDSATPALLESLFDAEAVGDTPITATSSSEMPAWLKADVTTGPDQPMDFDSIFVNAEEDEESEPLTAIEPEFQVEIDPSDTWAEAFDLEQDQGLADSDSEPEWYQRNVTDPTRIAAVEALATESPASLMDASLPLDEELSIGQRTTPPAWLVSESPAIAAVPADEPEAVFGEDVPEWLRETADAPIDPEMPAWLVETFSYDPEEGIVSEPEPFTPPAAPPAQVQRPSPVRSQPAAQVPARPTPPPRPQIAISADVMEALTQARELSRESDLESGLQVYEGLIRRSAALEEVVGDLEGLVSLHRTNPAVYRVLGDGLMRQGKLQQALDTYREALNQL